jgi:hypothetical protein
MKRITTFMLSLLLIYILFAVPVFAQKKGEKSPPLPKQENKEEIKDLPPLVPLTPAQPSKEKKGEEKKEESKGYKVIDAYKAEPKASITSQTQSEKVTSDVEKKLIVSSMLSFYYDNNVLLFSTQEMVNFSHNEWNPNLILGGTSAYKIKGYVDFATSPSLMLKYNRSILGLKPAQMTLYAEGSFYLQNQILNRGTFGLGINYPLSDNLSLKLSGFYQPERYYRELVYPEPYLNPYSTYTYETARYQTILIPLTLRYTISERVTTEFGYELLSRRFNRLFDNNNLFYQGLKVSGEFIPLKDMYLGVMVGGGYATANGDDPSTSYLESDPSHLRIEPGLYISYNGLDKISLGIETSTMFNIFTTQVEDDLQYYNRKDYLTSTYLWFGYEILKDLSIIASYNFAYNSSNFDRKGISANGVSDFEHQLIMLSIYYGDRFNIPDISRFRTVSTGF